MDTLNLEISDNNFPLPFTIEKNERIVSKFIYKQNNDFFFLIFVVGFSFISAKCLSGN